jgi:hypothetical protein
VIYPLGPPFFFLFNPHSQRPPGFSYNPQRHHAMEAAVVPAKQGGASRANCKVPVASSHTHPQPSGDGAGLVVGRVVVVQLGVVLHVGRDEGWHEVQPGVRLEPLLGAAQQARQRPRLARPLEAAAAASGGALQSITCAGAWEMTDKEKDGAALSSCQPGQQGCMHQGACPCARVFTCTPGR